jgi:hypothetical protein
VSEVRRKEMSSDLSVSLFREHDLSKAEEREYWLLKSMESYIMKQK